MRSFSQLLTALLIALLALGCVDPLELSLSNRVNVLVVDGTITNLAEHQFLQLNRSLVDPFSKGLGIVPVTKALVEVVVDSAQVIICPETYDGTYQLPSDFRGQVGHAYQLRITTDGTLYVSNQQIMQPVPPISRVTARFNPTSLPTYQLEGYRAGHDLFVETPDPADQRNYYRWSWKLYEKQYWCKSCVQGRYAVYNTYVDPRYKQTQDPRYYIFYTGNELFENCFYPPPRPPGAPPFPFWTYDYPCRTECWQILSSYGINVFSDQYSNGGVIAGRKVAAIPYYTRNPALAVVRQSSLTADAHRYFDLLQQQVQNTGGVADTPPTALPGNVQNTADPHEVVMGYFSVEAITEKRYWLDRKDATGLPFGAITPPPGSSEPGAELFYALNRRQPNPEPGRGFQPVFTIVDTEQSARIRPYTAVCYPSDGRTPAKPEGWQD